MFYDDHCLVKGFLSSSAGRDSGRLGLVLLFLGVVLGSECGDTCCLATVRLMKPSAGRNRSQRTALFDSSNGSSRAHSTAPRAVCSRT